MALFVMYMFNRRGVKISVLCRWSAAKESKRLGHWTINSSPHEMPDRKGLRVTCPSVMVGVAQLVEPRIVGPKVAGSMPVAHPMFDLTEHETLIDLYQIGEVPEWSKGLVLKTSSRSDAARGFESAPSPPYTGR